MSVDQIAEKTEFYSFGTNDLTQTVLGISRDDAQKSFLSRYVEQKMVPDDPFQVLDQDGVGAMMRLAVDRGVMCAGRSVAKCARGPSADSKCPKSVTPRAASACKLTEWPSGPTARSAAAPRTASPDPADRSAAGPANPFW